MAFIPEPTVDDCQDHHVIKYVHVQTAGLHVILAQYCQGVEEIHTPHEFVHVVLLYSGWSTDGDFFFLVVPLS